MEQELGEDLIFKHYIRLIFKEDNITNYPKIYGSEKILDGFLEIINELFSLPKNERQIFYKTTIDDIKDAIIIHNVQICKQYENTKFYLNENLEQLYNIIKKIHLKEVYSYLIFLILLLLT